MTQTRILELEELLPKCRDAYYNGEPLVPDEVYDALEDELRKLSPSHPLLATVGAPSSSSKWKKVSHQMPMSSLHKVNTGDQLLSWCDGVVRTLEVGGKLSNYLGLLSWSEKLDGISIALDYEGGELKRAVTRGDGFVGEDIISNVVLMRGVKRTLPTPFTGSLRGEIVLQHDDWRTHFPDYANPRNAASGIAKREDREKAQMCRYLTVFVYDVASTEIEFETEREKYIYLSDVLDLMTPNHGYDCSPQDVVRMYDMYETEIRSELNYDIDGIVVRFMDTKEFRRAGERSGRPYAAIALKFAAEGAVTPLTSVEWQVGNTGRITPVAVFEPVELVGATVTKASLYNYRYMTDLNVNVGDQVLVIRANDVIPRVEKVVTKVASGTSPCPTQCPVCSSPTEMDGEYLICTGEALCPAQTVGRIKQWVTALQLLDWGDFVIEALVEQGHVSDVPDLYTLEAGTIAALTNSNNAVVGSKTATKLLERLEECNTVTLDVMVGGLGIHLCRNRFVQVLMQAGYDTLEALLGATVEELQAIEGVGPSKAEFFVTGLQRRSEVLKTLLDNGHLSLKTAQGPLVGKSFCITGSLSRPRKLIEKDIVNAGGTLKGVGSGLSYLVMNDEDSSSSKAKKAAKLGIPTLTENALYVMMGS